MSTNSLNPDIRIVNYGVRELKEANIYPLSVSDQMKATDIISKVFVSFSSLEEMEDMEVVSFAAKTIKENIEKVLALVMDEGKVIPFDDLTNNQLNNIVNIIFEVNYEGIIKNFKDLFGKMKTLLISERS